MIPVRSVQTAIITMWDEAQHIDGYIGMVSNDGYEVFVEKMIPFMEWPIVIRICQSEELTKYRLL